jgi:hypothetical protein
VRDRAEHRAIKTMLDIQDIPGFDLLDEAEEPSPAPNSRGG